MQNLETWRAGQTAPHLGAGDEKQAKHLSRVSSDDNLGPEDGAKLTAGCRAWGPRCTKEGGNQLCPLLSSSMSLAMGVPVDVFFLLSYR